MNTYTQYFCYVYDAPEGTPLMLALDAESLPEAVSETRRMMLGENADSAFAEIWDGTGENVVTRIDGARPGQGRAACCARSGVPGLFQDFPGLDDGLKLGLGAAVAAVGVRVEAFQHLVIAGLDGRLVGAGLQVEVGQGRQLDLADTVDFRRGRTSLILGAATEQAEAVAPGTRALGVGRAHLGGEGGGFARVLAGFHLPGRGDRRSWPRSPERRGPEPRSCRRRSSSSCCTGRRASGRNHRSRRAARATSAPWRLRDGCSPATRTTSRPSCDAGRQPQPPSPHRTWAASRGCR